MADLTPGFDEQYDIGIEDVGVTRATAFCPICHAQIFGNCYCTIEADVIAHMDTFHSLVSRPGHA